MNTEMLYDKDQCIGAIVLDDLGKPTAVQVGSLRYAAFEAVIAGRVPVEVSAVFPHKADETHKEFDIGTLAEAMRGVAIAE